jgi:hypothetical protein
VCVVLYLCAVRWWRVLFCSRQVSDSVQQFRAIISRINADKDIHRETAVAPSSASRLPPRSNSISVSKPVAVVAAELEGSAKKPTTWPPPAAKVLSRPLVESTGKQSFARDAAPAPADSVKSVGGGGGGLTSEALLAHTASVGKQDMLGAFTGSRVSNISAGLRDMRGDTHGAVAREASRLDASQRQLRAAENRAKLEEEV